MSDLRVSIEKGKTFQIDDLTDSSAVVDGQKLEWDLFQVKDGKFNIIKNDKSYNVEVISADRSAKTVELKVNNNTYTTKVEDRFDILLQKLGMDKLNSAAVSDLKAPMPGMVLKIEVEAGQEIKKGDPLIVLEAMKMENVLKSPEDLTVKSVPVKVGVAVEKNQVLIEFES